MISWLRTKFGSKGEEELIARRVALADDTCRSLEQLNRNREELAQLLEQERKRGDPLVGALLRSRDRMEPEHA